MNNTLEIKKPTFISRLKTVFGRIMSSPSLYLLACFLLPLLLMWTIFIIRGVYPFGDKSVLVLDLNAQYVYFFEGMRDILQGDNSPFYTWYRALSGEFSGMYAYYVASPFAIITLFFSEEGITEALLAMTLLKCGSMGLTFGYYLHKTRPSKPVYVIMFSCMYALSSYAFVQAMNTMWMDALIYLPLILLGLEALIDKGRFLLYTSTLALCFIANFYIGFMVAIFVVLYFMYYYISRYKMSDFGKFFFSFYKFAFFSVIGACISAVILIPTYYSLSFGKNDFSNPTYTFSAKFDFLEIITQMMPNSYDTVRPEGLPFIYCGIVAILLLPLYFLTSRIRSRQRVMGGVMLAIMVLSFTGSTIDLFWHGMQKPNWLNYRYSFMFIFLVLIFAYDALRFLRMQTFRVVFATGGILGVVVMMIQKLVDVENGEFDWLYTKAETSGGYEPGLLLTIWFWMIMIGVLTALLWAVAKKKSKAASIVLCSVVCLELFINGIYDMFKLHDDVYYSTRTSYVEFFDRWRGITQDVQKSDISLYRMEKTAHRKVNDNMTLRLRGISGSTSTLNASVITLLNKLGYASKSHWSKYVGTNPVADSLIGIKYVLTDDEEKMMPEFEKLLQQVDPTSTDVTEPDMLYAYENPYALPMLYGVSEDILKYDWDRKNEDGKIIEYSAPTILNSIVSAMLGEETQIFVPVKITSKETDGVREAYAGGYTHHKYALLDSGGKGTVSFTFTVEQSGSIYIHFPSQYPRNTTLRVRDNAPGESSSGFVSKGSYLTNETHSILYIGEYEKGHEVTVQLNLKENDLYFNCNQDYIFFFDDNAFELAFKKLAQSKIKVSDFSDTHIKGTIDVQKGDELIFTSIPYDEGWTVKVDGKKVPLQKSLDSLLCFTASEGEHTIELSYIPQGFIIGLIACIFGLALLCTLTVIDLKRRKKRKERIMALIHSPDSTYSQRCEQLLQQMTEESGNTENAQRENDVYDTVQNIEDADTDTDGQKAE
ncbi:MAG: YfhO family protein [Clostridia bacterium]|nr:YfhO family protein [Clostridia bacterium]